AEAGERIVDHVEIAHLIERAAGIAGARDRGDRRRTRAGHARRARRAGAVGDQLTADTRARVRAVDAGARTFDARRRRHVDAGVIADRARHVDRRAVGRADIIRRLWM